MTDVKVLLLNSNIWNHLRANKSIIINRIICIRWKYLKPFNYVQKMRLGSFKNVIKKMCLQIIFDIYV